MSLNSKSLRTAALAVKTDINLYDSDDIECSVSHIIQNISDNLEEVEKSFEIVRKIGQYNADIIGQRIASLTVIDDIIEQMVERIQ